MLKARLMIEPNDVAEMSKVITQIFLELDRVRNASCGWRTARIKMSRT